jgi:uncharacterized protein
MEQPRFYRDTNSSFHALALTGGGFRGLFTARVLQLIEEHIQEPIGRRFDLVAGTSIGGILALAIGFEVPMERVVKVFRDEGRTIFPSRRRSPAWRIGQFFDLFAHLFVPRYHSGPLRATVATLIPADKLLGDSLHALVIPTVNVTTGTLRIMKTPHHPAFYEDAQRSVAEVALATSAAPTYFELAESKGSFFADGGLFANAPDLVAAHEADYVFKVPPDKLKLLSIGTLSSSFSIPDSSRQEFGIWDWMRDGRILELMISAQGQFAKQIMQHRLGKNYMRLDEVVDRSQQALPLDNSDSEMIDFLIARADEVAKAAINGGLKDFLCRIPDQVPNSMANEPLLAI